MTPIFSELDPESVLKGNEGEPEPLESAPRLELPTALESYPLVDLTQVQLFTLVSRQSKSQLLRVTLHWRFGTEFCCV